jgi:hypothetical protein
MKQLSFFKATILFVILSQGIYSYSQTSHADLQDLVGNWKLDLSPENPSDSNFAIMNITSITSNTFEGNFYQESAAIKEGRINKQLGIIYAALISGDNSGEYYSSFYMKDGVLHGSTHSEGRDFLAVWTATKNN